MACVASPPGVISPWSGRYLSLYDKPLRNTDAKNNNGLLPLTILCSGRSSAGWSCCSHLGSLMKGSKGWSISNRSLTQLASLASPGGRGWSMETSLSRGNIVSVGLHGLSTGWLDPKRRGSPYEAERAGLSRLVLSVTWCQFCYNLLVKISHEASTDSRGIDKDPTSPQERGKTLGSRTWPAGLRPPWAIRHSCASPTLCDSHLFQGARTSYISVTQRT